MMSQIPINAGKSGKQDIDREILRVGMIAELDAVNLYEQMAAMASDKNIKKMLLDIAKEEKTHVGEFQALLLNRDKEQVRELEEGRKEVKEETGE
jgi:rubrerythrin